MEQGKIRGIIKKKIDNLSDLSAKIGKDFDKENIHGFRVAVKNLRSFLRLLRLNTGTNNPKMPKKFKRLYHIAGAIRDVQLEIEQIADKQEQLPCYTNKLHLALLRQQRQWRKYYTKKTIRKLEEKLIGHIYPKLDVDTLDIFFSLRIGYIDELSKKTHPTDDQVHTIRKHTKDILYTSKLADKKWKTAKSVVEEIPLKQLDNLAADIGDYNDKRTTTEHLHSFSSPRVLPEEAHNIKSICNKDAKELKAAKKNIMSKARNLPFKLPVSKMVV